MMSCDCCGRHLLNKLGHDCHKEGCDCNLPPTHLPQITPDRCPNWNIHATLKDRPHCNGGENCPVCGRDNMSCRKG